MGEGRAREITSIETNAKSIIFPKSTNMYKRLLILSIITLISTICRSQYVQHIRGVHETSHNERITIESVVLNETKDLFIGQRFSQ